jgi:hypothetical protein
MKSLLLAHVILKPHLHPEDILGVGVLLCAFIIVALAIGLRRKV